MGSSCAVHGREWEQVLCVCGHGAGVHATVVVGKGCQNEHPTLKRELCNCQLDREEVLFAALQRSIAEVCEHRAQTRDQRRDPGVHARAFR